MFSQSTTASNPDSFEQLASSFEIPAKIIREFSALHRRSPDLAKTLIKQLAEIADVPASAAAAPRRRIASTTDATFAAVAGVFLQNENEPLTREEIVMQSGVSAHSLHTLIYRPHTFKRFESLPSPTGGKAKVFRLTERAWTEAQKASGE